MGWWGRGGELAGQARRWAALSPDPLPASHLSHMPHGGCRCPSQGTAGRAPQRPMTAQRWQGEGNRDRSGGAKLSGEGIGCC